MARNKYPEETVKLILDEAQRLFLEKGYEKTSIQDIINSLGGLSKGAIYHHFKSKEEIFDAVGDRFNAQSVKELQKIRDDKNITGAEKLKKMFELSLSNSDRDIVYTVAPNMLKNPRLLALQFEETFKDVVPNYVEPVINEGVADGSIKSEYPKELSEVLMLLTNLWLNPLVFEADVETMERRVRFFNSILQGVGINLLTEEMLTSYKRYCLMVKKSKEK